MTALIVAAVVVGLVSIGVVRSHNRFVDEHQMITDSWSNLETELQRRYDLLPELVETVKGYAAHERGALEGVLTARAAAAATGPAPAARSGVENQLVVGLRRLLAMSEAYPDLRANMQFLELQRQLATTENRIQAARRVYNGNVRAFNRRVESIPSNLVARVFDYAHADYFELDLLVRVVGAPAAYF